jgi:hypothetical protein
MIQTSTATTLLTYQPAVTNTKIGTAMPFNLFDHFDVGGFTVYFEFSRNTFTIQRYVHVVLGFIFTMIPSDPYLCLVSHNEAKY